MENQDFDLFQPTGLDRCVDQRQPRILIAQALGCFGSAMRRTIVDDPEDAAWVVAAAA
jgi:hypothetical protein